MSGLGDGNLGSGAQVGPGVALALRDASGSGVVVVVGGVAGSCDVGWVGGESEVVEDVTDELGIADVREDAPPQGQARTS